MTEPSQPGPNQPDSAKARFAFIQLSRLVGVFMVLFGVLLQAGRIEALRAIPRWAGFVLIVAGLFDTFLVPVFLARRWRSPKE